MRRNNVDRSDHPYLTFDELANLRLLLLEIADDHVRALKQYHDAASNGFYHRHDDQKVGRFSKSSTATCVLSLVATGRWSQDPWGATSEKTASLLSGLLNANWQSAGLDKNNAFTVAFILEAVTKLTPFAPEVLERADYQDKVAKAEKILRKSLQSGGASVQGYPASPYVTQLVVRVLLARNAIDDALREKVHTWAEQQIKQQLSLFLANAKTADLFQLCYSIILVTALREPGSASPDEGLILDAGLEYFFKQQRADGTWSLSRPLFHYPKVGSAHCYDYELLVQLLQEPRLRDRLLPYLTRLASAARALKSTAFELEGGGLGWSSGHHPQLRGPESWSTASVYHFAYALERLVAEAIRRELFAYVKSAYFPPEFSSATPTFADGFLDCTVNLANTPRSLKETLREGMVDKIVAEEERGTLASGKRLPAKVPTSLILFGPPGTSKTELASQIAKRLGWPLLSIDPSHFIGSGMDRVYAEADRIFTMLAIAERIVVLLDEFDEMVRERESAPDVLSRFLTTAMLPKLVTINRNRRLIFVVATNHIEQFDIAISRPGRFDLLLQVMPPTADAKLGKWDKLVDHLHGIRVDDQNNLRDTIKDLTFNEMGSLADKLMSADNPEIALQFLTHARASCTLSTSVNPAKGTKTWAEVCEEQKVKSRLL